MTDTKTDDVMSQFASSVDRNKTVEVLLQLFDKDKIGMITELNPTEIQLITRIKAVSTMLSIDVMRDVADDYMQLMLSFSRKSRKEVIQAINQFEKAKTLQNRLSESLGL